jgi:response regulator of citrate/malate metabolism
MVELKKYKKVVFIDDDVDLANSYVQKLKEKNLADYLICFSNVKDALGYLSKSKKRDLPDYILLDLYFPG